MPRELCAFGGRPITITPNRRELIGEILPLDGGLDNAVGEAVSAHWLKNQPPSNEAFFIGGYGRS